MEAADASRQRRRDAHHHRLVRSLRRPPGPHPGPHDPLPARPLLPLTVPDRLADRRRGHGGERRAGRDHRHAPLLPGQCLRGLRHHDRPRRRSRPDPAAGLVQRRAGGRRRQRHLQGGQHPLPPGLHGDPQPVQRLHRPAGHARGHRRCRVAPGAHHGRHHRPAGSRVATHGSRDHSCQRDGGPHLERRGRTSRRVRPAPARAARHRCRQDGLGAGASRPGGRLRLHPGRLTGQGQARAVLQPHRQHRLRPGHGGGAGTGQWAPARRRRIPGDHGRHRAHAAATDQGGHVRIRGRQREGRPAGRGGHSRRASPVRPRARSGDRAPGNHDRPERRLLLLRRRPPRPGGRLLARTAGESDRPGRARPGRASPRSCAWPPGSGTSTTGPSPSAAHRFAPCGPPRSWA